jgi:hypothetical protein
MIKLIAGATFALFAATSALAMTPAPIAHPDSMITQARFGCGPGMTMVGGACVSRSAIRQTRRAVRGDAYGAYGAGPGGDYANRSHVTGRPTLIPRHYGY